MDIERIYKQIVPASTLVLAVALLWFAFVYYPAVVADLAGGNFVKKTLVPQVEAVSYQFPIETGAFRLEYDAGSATYYAIIQGEDLGQYVLNRDSAKLVLKTALSAQSLCDFNVIYVSVERFSIPDKFKADC